MQVRLSILKEYVSAVGGDILCEGRVDDAREKYPDMEEEDFDYLVASQPTGSNNKYLLWTCKQADALLEQDPDRQGLAVVIQAVRLFDGSVQRLQKKDINQYDSVSEIEQAVQELGNKKTKSQEQKQAKADTDTIYQDNRFVVVRPYTTEASQKYGTGTKWCIAATTSHNYYNSYSTNNNKFYFVIDKQAVAGTPESKFAFAILAAGQSATGSNVQVYDASDKLVNPGVVAKHVGEKWPQIWDKIQAHVKANPLTREVEEAQKAVEEHVKSLLAGKDITEVAARKIASDAPLTGHTVKALLKRYEDRPTTGNIAYGDERYGIMTALSNRIEMASHDAAMMIIKWIGSVQGSGDSYYLRRAIERANLSLADFRELASNASEGTLATLFTNPNAPDDLKEQIAAQVQRFTDQENRRKVYMRLIETGEITEEQFRTAITTIPGLKHSTLYGAASTNLPAELIRLISLQNVKELKMVMKFPNVPADYVADNIDRLWGTMKKYDLYDILKTAPLAPNKVEQLWTGKGQDVRTALLQNPSISPDILVQFSKSRNSAYRFAVAHNPRTPGDALAELAADESVSTRSAVGANPETRAAVLTQLASDEAVAVRASVAGNSSTLLTVVQALTKDSDDFVRKAARKEIKSRTAHEAFKYLMMGTLLREALEDDDTQEIMSPTWLELRGHSLNAAQFVAVFLLQNNGHATREEIEEAFKQWSDDGGQRYAWRRGRRVPVDNGAPSLWKKVKETERYGQDPMRSTTANGRGWFWSPPGINKGALFRLTPAGAAAAMEVLERARSNAATSSRQYAPRQDPPAVRKSPPPRELDPNRRNEPAAPRRPGGPKTSYKVYGRMKGAPAHTRLKGQAYIAGRDTEFTPGEQAILTPDNGKLKVKKVDGDHEQTWEPTDG